jgi:hypothetical protein
MTKEKAKKLGEILLAYSQGRIIQTQSFFGPWCDLAGFKMEYINSELRIKPESKLVPFTFEDNKLFRDKWIRSKSDAFERKLRIVSYESSCVTVHNQSFSYQRFLDAYVFEDGSPCGKYIEE